MSFKVKKKTEAGSVTDLSLLIETSDRYEDWDDNNLISSIMEETGIPQEVAADIAGKVKERLQELSDKMAWTTISTSLIREMVEQEMLNKGRRYKNRAKKYRTLGLSENEITNIIENQGSADNGNLGHNPDAVLFVSAETMIKQYALKHVFPADVVDSHMQGDFSLHDLGGVFKVYAFSKKTPVPVRILDRETGSYEDISETFGALWKRFSGVYDPRVVDTQEIIDLEPGLLKAKDRAEWVGVKRLIRHNEKKEMRTFKLSDGSRTSVTSDHGCLVQRGTDLIITRADEVQKTDLFMKTI